MLLVPDLNAFRISPASERQALELSYIHFYHIKEIAINSFILGGGELITNECWICQELFSASMEMLN